MSSNCRNLSNGNNSLRCAARLVASCSTSAVQSRVTRLLGAAILAVACRPPAARAPSTAVDTKQLDQSSQPAEASRDREARYPDGSGEMPLEPLSPECEQQGRVAEFLGELAYQSLSVYGRIDPGVFERGGDGQLRVKPARTGIVPDRAAEFQRSLDRVKANPEALAALSEGYEQALKICEGKCPATRYPVTLTRQAGCGSTRAHWTFQGPKLPDDLSLKAFKALYQPQAAECDFGPPIHVASRAHGTMSMRHFFGAGCNCTRDDDTDGRWKRNKDKEKYCGSC
jgi:hypothetical protein